jgi:hypothetical protein
MTDLTLEHIDPRNGVLVSGLENSFNEILADYSYNSRKQNRFVPYRVCDHPAPVTFGDVGEFLIRGEWVVCEFGGPEWWDQSSENGCGAVEGGKVTGRSNITKVSREILVSNGKASGKKNATINLIPNCSTNGRNNAPAMNAHENTEKARKVNGRNTGKSNGQKSSNPVLCLETGIVYPSAQEAARVNNLTQGNISRCCRGERKTAGGLHWQLATQN